MTVEEFADRFDRLSDRFCGHCLLPLADEMDEFLESKGIDDFDCAASVQVPFKLERRLRRWEIAAGAWLN